MFGSQTTVKYTLRLFTLLELFKKSHLVKQCLRFWCSGNRAYNIEHPWQRRRPCCLSLLQPQPLPPLLLNEVLLREINIRFEQQVVLPVFLSRSQSNSWLKVARTLLGMRHILQQDHMRAIHNTDNNSKAHCHLQEKPCFFQQSFTIWLIYHSARLEQQCQELTLLSAALCYWSYRIVRGLVLNRSVFSEDMKKIFY